MAVPVPWKDHQELLQLKRWFFQEDPKRAVDKVTCYESRGSHLVPHAIASTAHLTAVTLLPDDTPATVLQLAYSMALVRFVNGMLDPTQQSKYAIPLSVLAKSIELPLWFVELRHSATHERDLPELEILQTALKSALQWLWDHYWFQVREIEEKESAESSSNEQDNETIMDLLDELKDVPQAVTKLTGTVISSDNFHPQGLSKEEKNKIASIRSELLSLWNSSEDRKQFAKSLVDHSELAVQFAITNLPDVMPQILSQSMSSDMAKTVASRLDARHSSLVLQLPDSKTKLQLCQLLRENIANDRRKRRQTDASQLLTQAIDSMQKPEKQAKPTLDVLQDLQMLKNRHNSIIQSSADPPIILWQKHKDWTPKPFGIT